MKKEEMVKVILLAAFMVMAIEPSAFAITAPAVTTSGGMRPLLPSPKVSVPASGSSSNTRSFGPAVSKVGTWFQVVRVAPGSALSRMPTASVPVRILPCAN